MTPVHIIGQPGSGKTTLIAALVKQFREWGLSVGTLKHSSHSYELDKPGKDSHVHRNAGACPAAMVNGAMAAIYLPISDETRPQNLIQTYYHHLDIVLIEGWISGPYPKIEVWRRPIGRPPLFPQVDHAAAIAADILEPPPFDAQTGRAQIHLLFLDDIPAIARYIQGLSRV